MLGGVTWRFDHIFSNNAIRDNLLAFKQWQTDAAVVTCAQHISLAYALVGYLEVQGVGPEGRVGDGGGDGAVVHEPELSHHEELPVPAHAEEGDSNPADILHVHAAKPVVRITLLENMKRRPNKNLTVYNYVQPIIYSTVTVYSTIKNKQ